MMDDESNADELRQRNADTEQDGFREGDWTEVPTDPEPEHLGYEQSEWERIPTTEESQVIFLPGNEEDLADDAFIVLEEPDLCDLVTRR
jgi:hypothetical protein